jgi:hypothetical protein
MSDTEHRASERYLAEVCRVERGQPTISTQPASGFPAGGSSLPVGRAQARALGMAAEPIHADPLASRLPGATGMRLLGRHSGRRWRGAVLAT